ncbi:MFS transporter [Virgibacillus sp. W0181]|uniref:MFS transporter n=1 Tax=Virgibacillus sp. W0181 TaxID=3391581 RepID=UPI003F48DCEA
MDKRVYLLTIIAFVVGMVELIIGGILDLIANDLQVTLGQAGQLISIFSLVFAISAPILLVVTSSVDRKRLTLYALTVFFIGNMIVLFSTSYAILLLARIIATASGSLLVVLSITLASSIVPQKYVGRAIGIVVMGVSGSLVLGVPIGLMLGNAFGWRAPFALICLLTILMILFVFFFMKPIDSKKAIPLKAQLATLRSRKILFTQLTTFLFLAGHIILYAYFTPFLKQIVGIGDSWISIIYLIFGIAAVAGGGLGGIITDRFGSIRVMLIVIAAFALTMFIIPYSTFALPIFLIVMIIWGTLSWAITPAVQSYLISSSPETAAIQQSLNNSALHFGIAFGSMIGGIAIERVSVENNATIGAFFVVLALGAAIIAIGKGNKSNKKDFSK